MGTNGKPVYIPIQVIKERVSYATNISIEDIELPNKWPGARKREKVDARNISMALSKDYSGKSLAFIGSHHGGRDHATVLHAHATVGNLLDTKDAEMTELYKKSQNLIFEWIKRSTPAPLDKLSSKDKTRMVKHWIKCHVPLFVRWEILQSIGKKCSVCGQNINNINYYGNRIKTVSNSLQRSYKK